MANLVSVPELAVWTRQDIEPDDPFALAVLANATGLIVDFCHHPEWEDAPNDAPRTARMVCLIVAARTFTNPDQEVSSSVGPISSRVAEEMAAGMTLTEAEEDQLSGLIGDSTTGVNGLWVLSTTRGTVQPYEPVLLYDNSGSPWPIEYADPNDTTFFDED
jgi:hypothetical protein